MVYRSKEEMAAWKARDPIPRLRQELLAQGVATEEEIVSLEEEIQDLLDEAVVFAAESPEPAPEMALTGVYGDSHDGRCF